MADQDRALAARLAHRLAHHVENVVQRLALGQGTAQGVVRVDPGNLQRTRVEVGTGKRLHMGGDQLLAAQEAGLVDAQRYRGDLQQRIVFGIEAAGLHVDHDRQETTEALGHADRDGVVDDIHRRSISAAVRCARRMLDRCQHRLGGGHAQLARSLQLQFAHHAVLGI